MDISKNRLEAFSDAVIAIIITIMVLDIPVPKDFTFESIRDMGVSFFIYFVKNSLRSYRQRIKDSVA